MRQVKTGLSSYQHKCSKLLRKLTARENQEISELRYIELKVITFNLLPFEAWVYASAVKLLYYVIMGIEVQDCGKDDI
jgi:hypothetical protein